MSRSVSTVLFSFVKWSACAVLLVGTGCGDNRFPVRAAKGSVVCDGKPVTTGSITFTPVNDTNALETGKPASASLGSEGQFVLTTFNRFDGAIVGKHRVQYNAPEEDGSNEESEVVADPDAVGGAARTAESSRQRQAQRKSQCVQKAEIIVEVKSSGDNVFKIELSPPGK